MVKIVATAVTLPQVRWLSDFYKMFVFSLGSQMAGRYLTVPQTTAHVIILLIYICVRRGKELVLNIK